MLSTTRRDCLVHGSGLGLSVSLGLGLFATGCAMPSFIDAPKNARVKPKVQVGDTWSYAEINRYNNTRQAVVTHRVSHVDPIIRIAHSAQTGAIGQEQTKERSEEIFDSLWITKSAVKKFSILYG
jgi:hypothetical protein